MPAGAPPAAADSRRRVGEWEPHVRYGVALGFAAVVAVVDALTPLGMEDGFLYVLLPLLGMWSPSPRETYIAALLGTALTVIGIAISPESTAPMASVWVNRGLSVGAIWATAVVVASQQRTRRGLLDERESKQQLLDVTQAIFVALDCDGRITMVNRKACELLGVEAADAIGRSWIECFIPEAARKTTRRVFRRLLDGDIDAAEFAEGPMAGGGGKEHIIAWHNALLRDTDGQILGTLSSGNDVTERFRAGEELRASRRALEDTKYALDQSAIVATTDPGGAITYANDKFWEISGFSREELVGQNHRIINSGYHPKAFFLELWRTIGGGQVWRGEIRNRGKDGSHYWVDTTLVPFLDERGRPYQYMAIRTDITDRKRTEDRLREQTALARLGEMASVVAHEVKNPLAGIGGALQIITGRLPEHSAERSIIADILERIRALNATMEDLLHYARPKQPSLVPMPLSSVVDAVAKHLAADPRFEALQIDIEIGDVSVLGDRNLLHGVFLNLIVNAAQAMEGRGAVAVTCRRSSRGVRIVVADQGPGIAESVREKAFEPFVTTKHRGTGLGLAIVKRVVDAHNGEVSIACPPSGGTVVTIELPVHGE